MVKYTKTAVFFHWLSALLIVAGFGLGLTMVNMHGISPTKLKYFSWHKWIGVTVLGLACLRVLWRATHKAPPYTALMPLWQQRAASAVHLLLYLLIFTIPISGYCYSLAAGIPVIYLGIIPLPVFFDPDPELKVLLKSVHFYLNMTLLVCLAMHVLAALKHQLIDRDHTLQRMTF